MDTLPVYLLTREQLLELHLNDAKINNLPSIAVDRKWFQKVSNPALSTEPAAIKPTDEAGLNMICDLPELPLEKMLSYLRLEDLIKARAVSRRWCKMIDGFRLTSLYYSMYHAGSIKGKFRLGRGTLALNFIDSPRFEKFFQAFGQSILSKLEHLRLHELVLSKQIKTVFAQTINSFDQLKELAMIRFKSSDQFISLYPGTTFDCKLNLPMLKGIRLEQSNELVKLTLDAPKLQDVTLLFWFTLELELVHNESVERLLTDHIGFRARNLKNLKCLHLEDFSSDRVWGRLLSVYERLEQIHLFSRKCVLQLFVQKQRYGRDDLKIYYCGLLLDGPNDPAIGYFSNLFDKETIGYLAEHSSNGRLADSIPFQTYLHYEALNSVPRGSAITLLKKFVDLNEIIVWQPVLDIERFLDLLKNCDNLAELQFKSDQAQALFDRLPEHCAAVQRLEIFSRPSDHRFLSRLRQLISLCIFCPIDIEFIREIFEEHKFLLEFDFEYLQSCANIKPKNSKQFQVSVGEKCEKVTDLDSVIKFIIENAKEIEEEEEEEDEETDEEEEEGEFYIEEDDDGPEEDALPWWNREDGEDGEDREDGEDDV